MAKFKKEYENGIVKYTLTFREKEFDISMIPTGHGTRGDKKIFSVQLSEAFPDLDKDMLSDEIDVDMLDCTSDEDEVFEILQELEQLEGINEKNEVDA